MSFGDHLEELRWRLIKALLGVAAGTVICFFFGEHLLAFLISPYQTAMRAHGETPQMINLNPSEAFTQYCMTCLIFGIGLSAPFGLYQLWQFVAAGLYPHERRWVHMFAPASFALFGLGIVFMIKIVMPAVLYFLISTVDWMPSVWMDLDTPVAATAPAEPPAGLPVLMQAPGDLSNGDIWISGADGSIRWRAADKTYRLQGGEVGAERLVRPQYSLQMYMSFVNTLCMAFGLGFQVPIVVVLLILLRIMSADRLSGLRKYIITAIVALAALLTPPDISSQLLLAGPMILLFEIGLFVGRRVERSRPSP